jgi:glucose/arabinose dehydrogenase
VTVRIALVACALLGLGCDDAVAKIHVPKGVRVTVAARHVGRPTNITFDSRGAMWMTTADYAPAKSDGVWRVAPRTHRGRQIVRGLNTALGLTWFRGELYVSHRVVVAGKAAGRITAFSHFDGRRFRRRRIVIHHLPVGSHNADSLAPGPDGRLYLGVGSVANAQRGPNRLSAALLSFRPDGRGLRLEARGLRNPYGLAFIPGTDHLLMTENGRDDYGLFSPPDELNLFDTSRRGIPSFGFPGCPGSRAACRHTTRPLARLAPHAGAGGVTVARRFARYGLSAFVAENGSSYPANPTGSVVVRVSLRRRGHGYQGVEHTFARGFVKHDPLGAAIGPGGALYVTLHHSSAVLRFSAGPPVQRRSTKR